MAVWQRDAMPYFPKSVPMVANKSENSCFCYIPKITKAYVYPARTYKLTFISAD